MSHLLFLYCGSVVKAQRNCVAILSTNPQRYAALGKPEGRFK